MPNEHFLVTGALGCIGAWTVFNLVRDAAQVTVFDVASNPHRLRLIMDDAELRKVHFVTGDVTNLANVEQTLRDGGITHIIHLAGLQVPFCRADPTLGAQVNVVGTVNIFEAAKRAGLQRVVYASSVAVYGRSEEYGEGPLPNDAPLHPQTLYGVYKQANEGTARVYSLEYGFNSIGLRPYTVYGPGRDQGMTSGPTKAMLAAALGKPYHIPFGGRGAYQFADDAARIFIQAARTPTTGAAVYNINGTAVTMDEIVEAIETVVPASKGTLTFDPKPLQLPEEVDEAPLVNAIGALPFTPLRQGVATTIETFKRALSDGRLSVDSLR